MMEKEEYMNLVEEQTREIIKMREELGIDIITSGEKAIIMLSVYFRKIVESLKMTQADMLEYIEDKREFENQLSILDVPAQIIKMQSVMISLFTRGDIVKK